MSKYSVSQENTDSPKNMLLIKNPQFLSNQYETLSKWGPHDNFILTKFRINWVKIVDFLIKAYFWFSVRFFDSHLTCIIKVSLNMLVVGLWFSILKVTLTYNINICLYQQSWLPQTFWTLLAFRNWPNPCSVHDKNFYHWTNPNLQICSMVRAMTKSNDDYPTCHVRCLKRREKSFWIKL